METEVVLVTVQPLIKYWYNGGTLANVKEPRVIKGANTLNKTIIS